MPPPIIKKVFHLLERVRGYYREVYQIKISLKKSCKQFHLTQTVHLRQMFTKPRLPFGKLGCRIAKYVR